MIIQIQNLLLSTSKAMNVNGSSATKTFSFTATSVSMLMGISVILKDDGSTTFGKFGAITGLTNGIIIQTTIADVTTDITTIKDNSDLCTRFPRNQFGNAAVLSILGISTPQGFGDSNDVFIGSLLFPTAPQPFILNIGDSIKAVVRDDLTNVDILEMAIKLGIDS